MTWSKEETQSMTPPYLSSLARFVAETPGSAIPADVRERAALIVADCVGCMVAGSQTAEVTRLARYCAERATDHAATVVGTASQLLPELAAWVGGTAGTWHDLDEGNLHTRAHAAIQIVPAALAEAEATGRSGGAFLDAFILAYEVAGRLWQATRARLAVHPHGTYGPLAAAVALCRLRGDPAEKIASAMNIAMTMGMASSRQALGDGATVRNIYTGHSGRAAFEALALRDMGYSGERDAPSSVLGNLYGEAFDSGMAAAGLGDVWWLRKSYFKRFASGRYTHAAMDAVETLIGRAGGRIDPAAVDRIDISTYFMAATMAHRQVDTPFGLRFSIPALIAAQIVRGLAPLTDDGAQTFADERVHALAQRIYVTEDKGMTAVYPDRQPADVTITWTNGEKDRAKVERALGESDHPLPEGTLRRKFIDLSEQALGLAGAEFAFDACIDLDRCSSAANLMANLRRYAAKQETG
tara:strand:+ start:201 stop:1607 length:1407 start_codon:yes stop_codon:yes gene_type:complete